MMDFELIKGRHSVRSFTERRVPTCVIDELNRLIDEVNAEGGVHVALVTDEPEAFGRSFLARYGLFRGVRNYLCLAGPKGDATLERIGYHGERILLRAQELGLNSCWVGLTFSKRHTRFELREGEVLHALIALGYGTTSGTPHRSKRPQQVAPDYDTAPEWFRRGVDWALLGPSSLRQQRFRFSLLPDGRVRATTGFGPYTRVDLGIARLHFEWGAAPHQVEWAE